MKAIDLFAGLGGFTEGATQAGCQVVWAANHWQTAVTYHAANHPNTLHACQDLHQADWERVPHHDIMLASPCCQGHAKARGRDKPGSDKSRATAWAVVSCAEFHRPPFIIVENVPEFLNWNLYPAWKMAMERLGYAISPHIFDSADFGVPQHRVRMFLILTHGAKAAIRIEPPKCPHVSIRSFIQWDAYRWNPINRPGRSLATLERIHNGRAEFGDRFVMPYYGSGSGLTGRSLDRPLGTVTTRDRWALVNGDRMRMLQPAEYRAAMGFPDTYKLPGQRKLAIHLLGNAVCPPVPATIIPFLN